MLEQDPKLFPRKEAPVIRHSAKTVTLVAILLTLCLNGIHMELSQESYLETKKLLFYNIYYCIVMSLHQHQILV